ERADCALACQFRELNAASAKLYVEAFALQPDLTQRHRHHAAWAAVLAATGVGRDTDTLKEPDRTRLRGRALVWLREEMDTWRKWLKEEKAGARPMTPSPAAAEPSRLRLGDESQLSSEEILQRIDSWLNDPDLSSLRDPALLDRLPVAERGDWERLWRDLRELRGTVRGAK